MSVEDNILIACFMEIDTIKSTTNHQMYKHNGWPHSDVQLCYHSSWDWLMHVVEKIESLGYRVEIENQWCCIKNKYFDGDHNYIAGSDIMEDKLSKIESVYNTVIEFIKRYNSQEDK